MSEHSIPQINGNERTFRPCVTLQEVDSLAKQIAASAGLNQCLIAGADAMRKRRGDKGRISVEDLDIYHDESKNFIICCVAAQVKASQTGVPVAFEFEHGKRNSSPATKRGQITDAYSRVGALVTVKRGVEKGGVTRFVQSASIDVVSVMLRLLNVDEPFYYQAEVQEPEGSLALAG
jgi:hypothetical protein